MVLLEDYSFPLVGYKKHILILFILIKSLLLIFKMIIIRIL